VRLRYTLRGAADLDNVLSHIAERSPQGARRVQVRIQRLTNLLLQRPGIGRLTSKGRLRRLNVYPYPYLIFYEISDDEIIVHGVRHSARDPSTMPE